MAEPTPDETNENMSRKIRRYAIALLIVAVALGIWGELSRVMARSALGRDTERDAVPTVNTVAPNRTDLGENLVLPGTVQAFIEAPIYARTSGYLQAWYTDIGTQVKKGQLLAEVASPEIDQQFTQAEAELATAKANATLAASTNKRWERLLETQSVSRQDAEEKAGDAAAKKTLVDSAAANVGRLRDLESFKRVVAPFDGVVTARNTDIGALINAGQNSGSELFRISDTHQLRIYVQVPENYAGAAKPGLKAELHFTAQPNKKYTAQVIRTSGSLDPTLRTLQVELQLDNADREVLPGAYAEVHFKLAGNAESLRLPANTVLFRAAGLQVATVDDGNKIKLKSIVQGRDFGNSIEVLSGIDANDKVVINPPDSITDGVAVRIAPTDSDPQADQVKAT